MAASLCGSVLADKKKRSRPHVPDVKSGQLAGLSTGFVAHLVIASSERNLQFARRVDSHAQVSLHSFGSCVLVHTLIAMQWCVISLNDPQKLSVVLRIGLSTTVIVFNSKMLKKNI